MKFTATQTSNGGLPNGQTLTFSYNGSPLGTRATSGGKAILSTTTLPVGRDLVMAISAGDVNYKSAAASATQAVN